MTFHESLLSNPLLYVLSFVVGSIVLWISAKILGSRLSLLSAFVITILSTLLSRILQTLLPLDILINSLIVFVVRIFLITQFGQVGIIRAFFINILPSIVIVLLTLLLIGGLGFYSLS